MTTINLTGPQYVTFERETLLESRMNLGIDYYFDHKGLVPDDVLNQKILNDINNLLKFSKDNKDVLELLKETNFNHLYDLKDTYGFAKVEYTSASQISDIMPRLGMLAQGVENARSIGDDMTLSFVAPGPQRVYYNQEFEPEYLKKLNIQPSEDKKLEAELMKNAQEFKITAQSIQKKDMPEVERQHLSSEIETSIAQTQKSIMVLKAPAPQMVSKKKIKDEQQQNLEVQENVKIESTPEHIKQDTLNYHFDRSKIKKIREKYKDDPEVTRTLLNSSPY